MNPKSLETDLASAATDLRDLSLRLIQAATASPPRIRDVLDRALAIHSLATQIQILQLLLAAEAAE